MVHRFKNNGYNIILDVGSGAIHVADDIMYDMVAVFEGRTREEVLAETGRAHPDISREELCEVYEELNALIEEGSLFSEDDYEEKVFDYSKRPVVVKALCLHVAHDCNLACRYCFAGEGRYHDSHGDLMSFETGKAALDYLVANSGSRRNLEVDFFGGEPLLNFQMVKELVAYGRSIEESAGKRFRFTLTTNGVLLDDEVLEFANRELYNVVLSIDGRKEVNDYMRPFRGGGRSTYEAILPRLKRFVKGRKGQYYVRGTYTRHNLDFSRDVLHLADEGFDQISVEPVVAPESAEYAIREEDIPGLFKEYDELAAELVRRNGTDKDFNFFHFMIDLEGGPCVYKRLTGCGSGTEYLAVTPKGQLYPCHQFVGNEAFLLGDVWKGIKRDDLVTKFKACNVYSKDKCRQCFARFYCSGGCAANAWNFTGDITGTYDVGCELQKKRIECAIMIKAALNSEGDEEQ